jgi:hypothetical protein
MIAISQTENPRIRALIQLNASRQSNKQIINRRMTPTPPTKFVARITSSQTLDEGQRWRATASPTPPFRFCYTFRTPMKGRARTPLWPASEKLQETTQPTASSLVPWKKPVILGRVRTYLLGTQEHKGARSGKSVVRKWRKSVVRNWRRHVERDHRMQNKLPMHVSLRCGARTRRAQRNGAA